MKLLFTFILFTGICFGQSDEDQSHTTALKNIDENDPLRVDELSQELIAIYSKKKFVLSPSFEKS